MRKKKAGVNNEKGKIGMKKEKRKEEEITIMAETEKQRYTDVLVYLLHHYSMP